MRRTLDEMHDTLQALATMESAGTIERNPRSTVIPERKRNSGDIARALGLLDTQRRGVDVHTTLGEGGMGVVRLGVQRALGRAVAVKSLKASARSDEATVKLLREAWVTGSLEHPNVVPVYDVSLDAEGQAQIVLKKIEGAPWSELLGDARAVDERFHSRDLLSWNLGVLMQVASAVHFAHSRGIVHRDLKPENVMLGAFGEVYVVDWGLAVSLERDEEGRLPHVSEATQMAGTPCYMAPEMLGGPEVRISPRTDVYLLGAILYELAVGRPPHEAPHLFAMLASVVKSEPEVPEAVPAELGRILRRALDADPDARFETAEQFRLALGAFLEHRGALALSEEADARLEELLQERERRDLEAGEQRLRLYHLFAECRFGYLASLRAWPQNEDASKGLSRAVEAMVRFELDAGDGRAAAVLLGELADPPAELSAQVREATARAEKEQQERARLAEDYDLSVGRRTRLMLGGIIGGTWSVTPLVWAWLTPRWSFARTHWAAFDMAAGMALLGAVLLYWGRASMLRTALNRRLSATVGLSMVAQCVLYGGAAVAGIPLVQTHVLLLLVWAVVMAMVALSLDRRLAFSSLGATVSFFVAAAAPQWVFYVMAASNFVLLLNMVVVWSRLREDVVDPFLEGRERRRAEWAAFLRRTLQPGVPQGLAAPRAATKKPGVRDLFACAPGDKAVGPAPSPADAS